MARCGRFTCWVRRTCAFIVAVLAGLAVVHPAAATVKYGPIEISGSVDTQNLFRASEIDEWQFIQDRNTALIRFEYDWLQSGKFLDRIDVPGIKRSKLYLLYRGTYDGFWGIAPGGRQVGVTRYDDKIGGPIQGNDFGTTSNNPNNSFAIPRTGAPSIPGCTTPPCPKSGLYTRTDGRARESLAFTNQLREGYIDLALTSLPLSFRLGRQQVIWGESDQFRLMDIINPLDTTWHLQQEEWDKIRVPLWLVKGIYDLGDLGPIANSFVELVWNPGDYQPGNKVEFLPAPWAVPIADPVRFGQIQVPDPNTDLGMLTPVFDLQGTSYRKGNFNRNPGDASAVGVRFHGVTDIPYINMSGFEFTLNYLWARGVGIGAAAGAPFGLKIDQITVNPTQVVLQNGGNPNQPAVGRPSMANPAALFAGSSVVPANVKAEFIHPYTHTLGATANYFEGNTNVVFRMETAYQFQAPFQSAALGDRENIQGLDPRLALKAPLGYTERNVWAGMLGFDRPTWIKFLNPRTTWFLTGQFFWSHQEGNGEQCFFRDPTTGKCEVEGTPLRGGVLTASARPYYAPNEKSAQWNAATRNGFGVWYNGPFAGLTERTQTACSGANPNSPCSPGKGVANNLLGNDDRILTWEGLFTLAATSFYWGGTFVPFVAMAIDPFNRNILFQLKFDYFLTNNLIIQPQAKFFNDLGSGRPSLDPWGAGGLNARRDEVGFKVTYQF